MRERVAKRKKKKKRAPVPSSSLPPNSGQRLTCPHLALVERVSGTGNVLEPSQSGARRHLTHDSRGSAAQAIPMAGGGFFARIARDAKGRSERGREGEEGKGL